MKNFSIKDLCDIYLEEIEAIEKYIEENRPTGIELASDMGRLDILWSVIDDLKRIIANRT